MKFIYILFIFLILINNSYSQLLSISSISSKSSTSSTSSTSTSSTSSTSSNITQLCEPIINTVSEVNPFISNSLIAITGIFCINNTNDISISFSAGNNEIGCFDITLIGDNNKNNNNDDQTILCTLDYGLSPSLLSQFNFNEFNTVVLMGLPINGSSGNKLFHNEIGTPIKSKIGLTNYLFVNSSCPNNCKENGICDIGNTCRCNQGYASFDCSHVVINETLNSPSTLSEYTFKMDTMHDSFSIGISHFLLNNSPQLNYSTSTSTTGSNTLVLIESISNMNILETISDPGNGFSLKTINESNWFSNLFYNVSFGGGAGISFSFLNLNGCYLPLSSTYSIISIYPTINSTNFFKSESTTILNDNKNGIFLYSIIFEIKNLKNSMNQYKIDLNSNGLDNSISLYDKKTGSLLVFSLSDLYDFNGIRVPNHAFLQIIPDEFSKIKFSNDYSLNSLYLSIFIPQSIITTNDNITNLSGTFKIQLVINVYNFTASLPLPGWATALIIVVIVIIFGLIVLSIGLLIRSRSKKNKKLNQLYQNVIYYKNPHLNNINNKIEDNNNNNNNTTSSIISKSDEKTPLIMQGV